jgi:thiamine biosynthesis protein ThiS
MFAPLPARTLSLGRSGTIGTVVTITLNGDPHELPGPVTVDALLRELEIDARRVAVEVNLAVVKKAAYETVVIGEGDEVEVVNFVGGG